MSFGFFTSMGCDMVYLIVILMLCTFIVLLNIDSQIKYPGFLGKYSPLNAKPRNRTDWDINLN
jgi:hypothetical protein